MPLTLSSRGACVHNYGTNRPALLIALTSDKVPLSDVKQAGEWGAWKLVFVMFEWMFAELSDTLHLKTENEIKACVHDQLAEIERAKHTPATQNLFGLVVRRRALGE